MAELKSDKLRRRFPPRDLRRHKSLTIGKHGSPWTPETARIEAKRLLAEIAAGRDPATARKEERNALSFGELIDLYLAEGAGHKKPSTLKADQGRIERHLRPLLGRPAT